MIDITGQEFGNLIALHRSDEVGVGGALWVCRCSCGSITTVRQSNLKQGRTVSCGCLRASQVVQTMKNQLFQAYKYSAKKRNLSWQLSFDEFISFIGLSCHYCGLTQTSTLTLTSGHTLNYNGIDRKDSSIGYVFSNLVPCCFRCNRAKGKSSYEEFIAYINAIAKFRGTKFQLPPPILEEMQGKSVLFN
jgi:5-methylcytosine-specific restriction endonuclease McrA